MKTWQNPTFAKWYLANRWTCSQVAKYVRWGRVFAKLPYFAKSFAKLLEECFKRFCQKSRMPTPFAKLLEMLSVKATLSLPHLFTDLQPIRWHLHLQHRAPRLELGITTCMQNEQSTQSRQVRVPLHCNTVYLFLAAATPATFASKK